MQTIKPTVRGGEPLLNLMVTNLFSDLTDELTKIGASNREKEAAYYSSVAIDLVCRGQWAEATFEFNKAVTLQPHDKLYGIDLALVLTKIGKIQEAITLLEKLARSDPKDLLTNFSYTQVLLEGGWYQRAWEQIESYEPIFALNCKVAYKVSTFLEEGFKERLLDKISVLVGSTIVDDVLLWQGQSLVGKNILLHPAYSSVFSGLGDGIMLMRFVPRVAELGANIVLAVERPLRKLASQLPNQIWTEELTNLKFDYRLPLSLLPKRFEVTLGSIPTQPYLIPDPILVAYWQERIFKFPGLRVGLVWRSGGGLARVVKPEEITQLLSVAGVSFFSLQVHEQTPSDLKILRKQGEIIDLALGLTDFSQTAAAITALDLVISIDTSVANLCGAMGREDWVLVPVFEDFRWRHGWFPTMKVFRQTSYGQWNLDEVIEQLSIKVKASASGYVDKI